MFEIKVADTNITGGSIPVSWCLGIETIKQLSEYKTDNPTVVIVVAPEGEDYDISKETRVVAPLKDLLAYVPFKVSGKVQIRAFIDKSLGSSSSKDMWLCKGNGEYITTVISSDGEGWSYIFPQRYINDEYVYQPQFFAPTLSVDIPEQAFAKCPAQWERTWVNHFFRSKPEDQCEFRRRRLFAYILQPFVVMLMHLIKLIFFLLALSIGSKKVSLKPLLHPLRYDLSDAVLDQFGESIFIRSPKGKLPNNVWGWLSYIVRSFFLVPFMPIVLIPAVLLFFFKPVLFMLLAKIVLLSIVLFAIVFALISTFTSGNVYNWWCRMLNKQSQVSWYADQEEIDMLTCNTNSSKALTFETLPTKKQSLRLRLYALKSKVCRPFSS